MRTIRKNNRRKNKKYTKRNIQGGMYSEVTQQNGLDIILIINLLFEVYNDNQNRIYLVNFLNDFEIVYKKEKNNIENIFNGKDIIREGLVDLVNIILKHIIIYLNNKEETAIKYLNIIILIIKKILNETIAFNNDNIFSKIGEYVKGTIKEREHNNSDPTDIFINKLLKLIDMLFSALLKNVAILKLYKANIDSKLIDKLNDPTLRKNLLCYLDIDKFIYLIKLPEFVLLIDDLIINDFYLKITNIPIVLSAIYTFSQCIFATFIIAIKDPKSTITQRPTDKTINSIKEIEKKDKSLNKIKIEKEIREEIKKSKRGLKYFKIIEEKNEFCSNNCVNGKKNFLGNFNPCIGDDENTDDEMNCQSSCVTATNRNKNCVEKIIE